jgi:hypothetical protein
VFGATATDWAHCATFASVGAPRSAWPPPWTGLSTTVAVPPPHVHEPSPASKPPLRIPGALDGVTVQTKVTEVLALAALRTVTVTVLVPAADGVPVTRPVRVSRLRPLGSPVADQVSRWAAPPWVTWIGNRTATPTGPVCTPGFVTVSAVEPGLGVALPAGDERGAPPPVPPDAPDRPPGIGAASLGKIADTASTSRTVTTLPATSTSGSSAPVRPRNVRCSRRCPT